MRKLRTLIALVTVAALLLSFGGFASAQYTDVPAGAPYAGAVELLTKLNIVTGFPDNTFRPDELLTREQFATFVVRALGRDKLAKAFADNATTFKDDAKISSWARGYVVLAASMKIVNGFPDGTFRPQEEVTYAQALAMLVRALGFETYAKGLGGWPAGYLVAAEDLGLTKGIEEFVGDLPIDRADMAVATFNAVVADYRPDAQTGAPVKSQNNDGSNSLLRRVFGYTASQYSAAIGNVPKTVTGTFKGRGAVTGRIDVDGTLYDLATSYTVTLNGVPKNLTDLQIGDKVTLTLDASGKVTAIAATRTTFPNAILTGITITETPAYGEITVSGATYAILVDRSTTVTVDGKAGTLADADAALKALRSAYPGKNAIVTVVTEGNDTAANNKAKALSISVITTNVVTGTVTAAGNDSGGNYVRIQPDGATDTVKVYYEGFTLGQPDTFNVGQKVTLLKGSDEKARVVLKVFTAPGPTVFWAHVLGIEKDASNKLVSLTVHTEKMDSPATATYAGAKKGTAYSVDAANYTANSVLAVEVTGGVVTKLSATGSDVSANLKSGTAAGAAVLVSGSLYRVTVGTDTVFIDASKAVFLQANGTHSVRRVSAITNTTTIYYYFDGNNNVAQVVKFADNDQ